MTGHVHGDVKSFTVATFPYDNESWQSLGVLVSEPAGQAYLSQRIKGHLELGGASLDAHHVLTVASQADPEGPSAILTGNEPVSTQAIDLSWDGPQDDLSIQGRIDRLVLRADAGGARLSVGRQAITVGNGMVFTPLDLVNPFTSTQIDHEYKPGVDSARAEYFWGLSNRVSVAAVYGGGWDMQGMIYTAYAQTTLGRTDTGLFFGAVHGDEVMGLTASSYLGPVAIYGDTTVTHAAQEDWFFRGVTGASHRLTETAQLTAELYYQSLGTTDPAEYLDTYAGVRYARRELWLVGTSYGALAVSQEITPLVSGSVSCVANLADPSALLATAISWNVSNEAVVSVGGYFGAGSRPDDIDLLDLFDTTTGAVLPDDELGQRLGVTSEFGLIPNSAYVQMSAYF